MDVSLPFASQHGLYTAVDLNWAAGQYVTFTAVSAQSAAIAARVVLVSADANCWIAAGTNPSASAGAGSVFVSASAPPFLLAIQPSWKIAVVQATAGGHLSIMPGVYPG